MKTTKLKKDYCPACGVEHTAATSLNEDVIPEEGDVSLCIECGIILAFNKDLTLRLARFEDYNNLDAKQFLFIKKAQEVIKNRNKHYRK